MVFAYRIPLARKRKWKNPKKLIMCETYVWLYVDFSFYHKCEWHHHIVVEYNKKKRLRLPIMLLLLRSIINASNLYQPSGKDLHVLTILISHTYRITEHFLTFNCEKRDDFSFKKRTQKEYVKHAMFCNYLSAEVIHIYLDINLEFAYILNLSRRQQMSSSSPY